MTLPVTIADRFRAAWKAFKQHRKPDPEAFAKFMAKREAELRLSLEKLDGYDRALVTSIAGKTENWEKLLDQVMPAIEQLEFAEQFNITKCICKNNSRAVIHPAMRQWSTRNQREVSAALMGAKDTVIVVAK